ncbi:AAA family ATPase [uncultured Xanthomonas sp.]|uniref:KGGVGR-motif variant AAA ATPase n=1 Tax=uncultured Xanthomonas sp. TaxID=152831 RepID=UPI0025D15039|nr:AAA family ATPase [uncultured Xanthomonas sp.]
MAGVTFDNSLSKMCSLISSMGYEMLLEQGWFVRDVVGALGLIIPDRFAQNIDMSVLRGAIAEHVGRYSQCIPDNLMKQSDHSLGEMSHLALPEIVRLEDGSEIKVCVIDRRANGQDWLMPPSISKSDEVQPPRLVFWSLKGGVGRTTALSMLASSLANDGHNVLVVDLDLEAPGVGDHLLREGDRPLYGVLDYLVELRAASIDAEVMLADAIGTSGLTRGAGLVHVCPAVGSITYKNPGLFLGKLFRAYGAQVINGVETTFAGRIDQLIRGLTSRGRYDAVLIDARAGMSESTAASILNLNGDVLLFGHNTPQTFSGYSFAFAHMSSFVLGGKFEWIMRLKMVHAKASLKASDQAAFRDEAFEIFSKLLYADSDEIGFSLDDLEAPHYAWVIADDSNFRDFDPIGNPDVLSGSIASAAFGEFIKSCKERLRV